MNHHASAQDLAILAVDRSTADEALQLVDRVGSSLLWVKLGLEIFTAEGPSIVRAMKDKGHRVFLDLKLHDIPNTVAKAVSVASGLGADLLTLHAEGGPKMMEAAAQAAEAEGGETKLLAVTVLTSLSGEEFPRIYQPHPVAERVAIFAKEAEASGVHGVICSPKDLQGLRAVVSNDFLRVTPGIRPAGAAVGDQVRVATPRSAIEAGASKLVIGRAVTAASDPQKAWEAILEEIAEVSTQTS